MIDRDDSPVLEDLIAAAVNGAGRKVQETMQEKTGDRMACMSKVF